MEGQVVERQSGRTGNHEQQQRDIGIGGAAESQEHMQNVGAQGKKREWQAREGYKGPRFCCVGVAARQAASGGWPPGLLWARATRLRAATECRVQLGLSAHDRPAISRCGASSATASGCRVLWTGGASPARCSCPAQMAMLASRSSRYRHAQRHFTTTIRLTALAAMPRARLRPLPLPLEAHPSATCAAASVARW